MKTLLTVVLTTITLIVVFSIYSLWFYRTSEPTTENPVFTETECNNLGIFALHLLRAKNAGATRDILIETHKIAIEEIQQRGLVVSEDFKSTSKLLIEVTLRMGEKATPEYFQEHVTDTCLTDYR